MTAPSFTRPLRRTLAGGIAALASGARRPAAAQAPDPPPARGPEQHARAQSRGLTLDDVLMLALRNSPAVRIQQENARVGDVAVQAATHDLLVPQVSVSSVLGYTAPGARRSGSVLLAEQPAVYSSSYAVSASYTVSAARLLQPGIARAERRAAASHEAASEADVRRQVTQQYLAVLQAGQVVEQAEREVTRAEEYWKLARVREALGLTSALDVKRAEVQLAQAGVKRVRARHQQAIERLTLGQTVGVRFPDSVELSTRFPLFAPSWTTDSLVALAFRHNPALLAAEAAAGAARARLQGTRFLYQPVVSMSAGVNGWAQRTASLDAAVRQQLPAKADSATVVRTREQVAAQFRGFPFNYARQPVGVSLSVSLPVLQGGGRLLQRQQALATEENAVQQRRSEELRVRTEVETGVLTLQTAYEAARMQRIVREKAADELRLARDRARFGAVAGTAVADAYAQLSQAEVDEIDAVHAFHRQLAALEALVGARLSPNQRP